MAKLTLDQFRRAKDMHRECMKDPEYAKKWNALVAAMGGLLCDIPEEAIADDEGATLLPTHDGGAT
jgi:hypothetical protein